ncbi:hypothetical protein C0Q70_12525 [Pomacea canaliculata]|uniref:Uncharacterized protein n=1 Tax=Pomacea canaliculata TaxID=400727 RepID=A0A2T7P1S9_POMCA|nr:hypothetical protein C0Q70_12525 [Pomacea canaliculata]
MQKRARTSARLYSRAQILRVRCVLLAIVVASLLLCSGDVELNPGPEQDSENTDPKASSRDVGSNDDMKLMITAMFQQQQEQLMAGFNSVKDQLSSVQDALSTLGSDISDLRTRTVHLEEEFDQVYGNFQETTCTVTDMEGRLREFMSFTNEKIDKLEAYSRKDNLKFYGIQESDRETFSTCAQKVVDVLHDTVPNKVWALSDIVRAHRVGPHQKDKPRAVIVRFTRWADKMEVLTKGRNKLHERGVKVSGDLTARQREILREHRSQGLHAYYVGDRLIVEGTTQRRHDNTVSRDGASQRSPITTWSGSTRGTQRQETDRS